MYGRWGLESIALSPSLNNFTYGNTTKHKVFILEKIEEEKGQVNLTVDPGKWSGIVGLSKKTDSKATYESYGEYLKRRNLISTNTLAVELINDNIYKLNFTFGVFNKTTQTAPMTVKRTVNATNIH